MSYFVPTYNSKTEEIQFTAIDIRKCEELESENVDIFSEKKMTQNNYSVIKIVGD